MAAKLSKLSALQTAGLYSLREFAEAKRRIFAKIASTTSPSSSSAAAAASSNHDDEDEDHYDEDAAASALDDYRQSVSGPADLSRILADIRLENEDDSTGAAAAEDSQVPGFDSSPLEEHKEEASASSLNAELSTKSDGAIAATTPSAASLNGDLNSLAARNRLRNSRRPPVSSVSKSSGLQAKKGKATASKTWDLLPGGTVRLMVVVGDTTTPEGVEALEVDAVVAPELTLATAAAAIAAHASEGGGGGGGRSGGGESSVDIYDGHSVQWQAAIAEENDEDDESGSHDNTTMLSALMHRLRGEPTKSKKRKTQRSSSLTRTSEADAAGGARNDATAAEADEERGLDLLRNAARIAVAPLHAAIPPSPFNEGAASLTSSSSTSDHTISASSSTVEFLQAHARAHTACLRLAAEKGAESLAFPVDFCAEVGEGARNSLGDTANDDDDDDIYNGDGKDEVVDSETKDEHGISYGSHGSSQMRRERPRAAAAAASLSRAVLLENALRAIRRVVYDINMPKRVTQERDATKRDVDELAAQLARATLDKDLLDGQIASLQRALGDSINSSQGAGVGTGLTISAGNKSRTHHAKEWQWSSSFSGYTEMSEAAAVVSAAASSVAMSSPATDAAEDAALRHERSALLALPAFTLTATARASQRTADAASRARKEAEKRAASMATAQRSAAAARIAYDGKGVAAAAEVFRSMQGTSGSGHEAQSSDKATPPAPSQPQDAFDSDDELNSSTSDETSHLPPVSSPMLPPPLIRASSHQSNSTSSIVLDHSDSRFAAQPPPATPLPTTESSTIQVSSTPKEPASIKTEAISAPSSTKDAVDDEALSVGLPVGWSARIDPATETTYYYHAATKQTSWTVPREDASNKSASSAHVEAPVEPSAPLLAQQSPASDETFTSTDLPTGWTSHYNEVKSATYYYNEATRETSWVLPVSAVEASVPIETPSSSSIANVEPASSALPAGWISRYDDAKQATYYYNETTRETSWVLPVSAVEASVPIETLPSGAETAPPGFDVSSSAGHVEALGAPQSDDIYADCDL